MEIVVAGSAERWVTPEVGVLEVALEQEGEDREFVVDLTAELARRFSEAVAPLKPTVVIRWSLQPVRVHTWRSGKGGGTLRYRATVQATITFRDFQALADFAVSWGSAPGVEIQYTSWALSSETERRLETELLTEAVTAGRRRAETMAQAAGATLTGCVELSDHPVSPDGAFTEAAVASAARDSSGVVEPEQICRGVTVYARYRAE
ncbi:MAG: SIMPL domain-containing protein [Propionibacteriaceae bacterium]|nr:SIMPL domain-containing protein [Propionibacteriaceae bacterium]